MLYKFIGWCQEDNHDKVWGVIYLENSQTVKSGCAKCVTFWGRRGKKLQTKICIDDYDLAKLIRSKTQKGYQEVNADKLNQVYPEFEADLQKTAIWAMLKF